MNNITYRISTNESRDKEGNSNTYIRISHSGFESWGEAFDELTTTKEGYESVGYTPSIYYVTYMSELKGQKNVPEGYTYELDLVKDVKNDE